MADTIDINVSKTTETITINSTPNLTTININTVTGGGGLVTSVNGDIGDVIVPVSDNNFTNALKTKLDGIAAGAEVNVNADWNATSGDAQILNKPTIPSISGLELQANKQNSLDVDGTGVKYPTVDAVNNGITNVNTNAIDKITVKLSTAINKGQAVYVSSADGTNIIVSKASNTSESTSSKTIGLLETTGTTNAIVNAVTDGLLTGLNTSTATIGDPVWLGTNGDLIYGLTNKPYAPAHLVYIGIVTRVNTNNGEILVKVQNGFELKEIHDIDLISNSPTNNQALVYESSSLLWKNKTVDKTFVGLSNVDNTTDANKPVSTATQTALDLKVDKVTGSRLITSAESTLLGNTSGVNTGDETITTIKSKLGITTLSGSNTGDQDLSNLVVKNTAITGATKTKITYDAKGLVSAGADATTADIADSTNKRYQTDNQNSFNDATSSIQTQINAKSNKSISSYSLLVNNTASTADVTETTYKSPSQQTYTGTITWTGTTAPSGATNHTYNWIRVGNLVTLKITLIYATGGAVLSNVIVTLPTDCPTPLKPTGFTAANNNLYSGTGFLGINLNSIPSATSRVILKSNAANNGFEIYQTAGGGSYLYADLQIQYFTS